MKVTLIKTESGTTIIETSKTLSAETFLTALELGVSPFPKPAPPLSVDAFQNLIKRFNTLEIGQFVEVA